MRPPSTPTTARLHRVFGDAALGRTEGGRYRSTKSKAARTAPQRWLKQLDLHAKRLLNAVAPGGQRAEQRLRGALRECSHATGDLLARLARSTADDISAVDLVLQLNQCHRAAQAVNDRDGSAPTADVFDARLDVHLRQLTPAQLDDVERGVDALLAQHDFADVERNPGAPFERMHQLKPAVERERQRRSIDPILEPLVKPTRQAVQRLLADAPLSVAAVQEHVDMFVFGPVMQALSAQGQPASYDAALPHVKTLLIAALPPYYTTSLLDHLSSQTQADLLRSAASGTPRPGKVHAFDALLTARIDQRSVQTQARLAVSIAAVDALERPDAGPADDAWIAQLLQALDTLAQTHAFLHAHAAAHGLPHADRQSGELAALKARLNAQIQSRPLPLATLADTDLARLQSASYALGLQALAEPAAEAIEARKRAVMDAYAAQVLTVLNHIERGDLDAVQQALLALSRQVTQALEVHAALGVPLDDAEDQHALRQTWDQHALGPMSWAERAQWRALLHTPAIEALQQRLGDVAEAGDAPDGTLSSDDAFAMRNTLGLLRFEFDAEPT